MIASVEVKLLCKCGVTDVVEASLEEAGEHTDYGFRSFGHYQIDWIPTPDGWYDTSHCSGACKETYR